MTVESIGGFKIMEENIKLIQELLTKNAYGMQKRNANESQKFYESEIPISDSLSVWINFGEDDMNFLNLKE
jgi:hypothetical protein